jgi:hypothetical protein
MTSFYARFIPEYSESAVVLHALKREGVKFDWTEEYQVSFDSLKQAMTEAPVLQVPDFGKEFILVTDASELAISAFLNQRVCQDLAPVSYYGLLLTPAERNYSTYEECLVRLREVPQLSCEMLKILLITLTYEHTQTIFPQLSIWSTPLGFRHSTLHSTIHSEGDVSKLY